MVFLVGATVLPLALAQGPDEVQSVAQGAGRATRPAGLRTGGGVGHVVRTRAVAGVGTYGV